MNSAKVHKIIGSSSIWLFTVFFCVFWSYAGAQEVTWSNARKLKGFAVYTQVIGENDNGLYLIRYKSRLFSRNIILEKYRKELGYAYSRNLIMKRAIMEYAYVHDDALMILRSDYHKKSKTRTLRAQFFNDALQQKAPDLLLLEQNVPGNPEQSDLLFERSLMDGRLLICSRAVADNPEQCVFEFRMFSSELNPVWSKQVIVDKAYKDVLPIELKMHENLGLVLLFKSLERKTKKGPAKPKYFLLHLDQNPDKMERLFSPGDSNFLFTQPVLVMDRFNNRLVLAQIYAPTEQSGQKGIHLWWLNEDSTSNEQYVTFDSALVEHLNPQRTLDGKSYISDFKMLRIVPQSDGGLSCLFERSSMASEDEVVFISGIAQNTSRNMYNFDDVCVLSLDTHFEKNWHHVLGKNQNTINDGGYFSSVVPIVTPEGMHLLYNDMLLNLGTVMQQSIWADGSIQSRIVLGNDREFVSVIPSEAIQLSRYEWVLPVIKDRKFALVKLNYRP